MCFLLLHFLRQPARYSGVGATMVYSRERRVKAFALLAAILVNLDRPLTHSRDPEFA